MTAGKHTQGPWETDGLTITGRAALFSEHTMKLATMAHFVPEPERRATAQLMASAHMLHQQLETFVEWARQVAEREDVPAGIRFAASGLHKSGAAALAKATGSACTVCGTPESQHGTYPTCASHPYTPDEDCRHVIGARCPGAECNTKGCVRAAKDTGGGA